MTTNKYKMPVWDMMSSGATYNTIEEIKKKTKIIERKNKLQTIIKDVKEESDKYSLEEFVNKPEKYYMLSENKK